MNLMKAIVFFVLLLLCDAEKVGAQTSNYNHGSKYETSIHNALYLGTLGNSPIGLFINSCRDSICKGHYFYYTNFKDIPLEGIDGQNEITFTTVNSLPSVSGAFHLYSDAQMDTLYGNFTSGGGQKYLVTLKWMGYYSGSTYSEEADSCVKKFYYALLSGDRNAAADYVSFPLRINTDCGHYFIKNKKQFLKKYDRIFVAKMIELLKKEIPHDLFANDHGIMIGPGYIWFEYDGKASAINIVY
jgi:hypothetical protein